VDFCFGWRELGGGPGSVVMEGFRGRGRPRHIGELLDEDCGKREVSPLRDTILGRTVSLRSR
jgi:hypothetical protein